MTSPSDAKAAGTPRLAQFNGPALLLYGFRPFFLAAGIWAPLAIVLWVGTLHGGLAIPTDAALVTWHGHELLFGYATAAVAGFLLTAIPNWTGKLPLRGWPLGGLAALWLAGRLAVSTSASLGPGLTAAIDLSFMAALLVLVLREIITGKNWRNLPMVGALLLLLVANLLTHLDKLGGGPLSEMGMRLGMATIAALIALVGGRIIPSFTRNWLKKRGHSSLPATFGQLDRVALLVLLAALIAWTAAPATVTTAFLGAAAAVMHFARLARWRGLATLREPLLWVLHLGYLWLPIGLALVSLGALGLLQSSTGIHALTVGAVGTMTLAVMTRATRGHTGRQLTADAGTTAIFVCITLAAISRVVAALAPSLYGTLVNGAALFWTVAFVLFLVFYAPMLVRPGQGVST